MGELLLEFGYVGAQLIYLVTLHAEGGRDGEVGYAALEVDLSDESGLGLVGVGRMWAQNPPDDVQVRSGDLLLARHEFVLL